jgi:hypothetical protein
VRICARSVRRCGELTSSNLSKIGKCNAFFERFSPKDQLQKQATLIINELIRRGLITVTVRIDDPACSFCCKVTQAVPEGSNSFTTTEIAREFWTGKAVTKTGGPGIELSLDKAFRLTPEDEKQVRALNLPHPYEKIMEHPIALDDP